MPDLAQLPASKHIEVHSPEPLLFCNLLSTLPIIVIREAVICRFIEMMWLDAILSQTEVSQQSVFQFVFC